MSKEGLTPFYERLLQFPLFQGMSRTELLQMAGNTRFDFRKIAVGKQVVEADAPSASLFFLVQGTATVVSRSDDRGYQVTEELHAPWIVQPEVLFGLSTRYTCSVRASSPCHFLVLHKDEVLRLQDDFLTFRLNLLNLLSTQSQQLARRCWRRAPRTLTDAVVRFFSDHCLYPAGRKEFHILMTRLAAEVNDSRLDVSRVLNALQADGLVELYRGRIVIPSLERLFM